MAVPLAWAVLSFLFDRPPGSFYQLFSNIGGLCVRLESAGDCCWLFVPLLIGDAQMHRIKLDVNESTGHKSISCVASLQRRP
jgi:hypothetical protein